MQAIKVNHEYFEGPWLGVSFQPNASTLELMRKYQIIFRETIDGFYIMPSDPENVPQDVLVFSCYPSITDYVYYTELPPRGMILVFRCDLETDDIVELSKPLDAYKEIQSHQPPCFLIEIPVNTKEMAYQIKLQAKSLRWKYILSSAVSYPDLEIIDTLGKEVPMVFIKNADSFADDGIYWLTKEKVELRAQPSQRFQLREVKSGKVVMKRLPCANGKLLVKEKDADGNVFPAAEVYLNP